MQKEISKSIKNQYFLMGLLIISLPFLEFIESNYYLLSESILFNITVYFFILLIIYSLIYLIIKKKISSEGHKLKYILCFGILIWSLFQFSSIQNFLYSINLGDRYSKNLTAEISLIIILLFSLSFLFNNFTKFIYKFLIFFFIIQHLIIYFTLVKNFLLVNFQKENNLADVSIKEKDFFSDDEVKFILNKKDKKNIYYLIIENLTSFDEYKKLGGKQNTEEWEERFSFYGYKYISDTYSVYTNTADTLGSILNLRPIITDKSVISPMKYKSLRYPETLSSFKLDDDPKLINNLSKIDYDFKWIGNSLYKCKNYNEKICLEYIKKKDSKIKFFTNKININTLSVFLDRTPIEEIIRTYYNYSSKVKKANSIKIKNGSIERFIRNKEKFKEIKKFNFYFIHDLGITRPIKFNKNCDAIDYGAKMENEDNKAFISRYLKSYECMIERIERFMIFINKVDPNAVVIIQSDHGIRKIYTDPYNIRRYKILNIIKVSDECKNHISNKIDNINSVRLSLSCATSTPIKNLKKRTYFRKTIVNNKNFTYEIPLN